ncbi:GNAT family N-acetyltransferase [Bacillus sp. JJ1773]|uniref:GNAT family N-acetyltransferase n=1 Tax=Bacillus sp. JJ1773 TaxID=3122965 RepID=UPI002FFE8AD9
MIILNQSEFDKVKSKLRGNNVTCPTFAYSVLDGYIKGTVYAESRFTNSVLIGTNSGIYFAAGESDNLDFNHFLFELYRQRKNKKSRFTLFSSSKQWDYTIKNQLKDEIKQLSRFSFTYENDKKLDDNNLLSCDYSIEKINTENIKKSLEFNEEYYNKYWGSISNFIENGFGFCILHNRKVVSECTSIFSSQQFAEVDIATHKDYRGQGLASIIANAFTEHCLKNRIVPRWDCDVSNTSSIHLAEKLGFVNPVEYSIFV